ncbi:MAG: hypothetical protein U0570_10810 [Phycisphaerales bacterium]
MPLQTTGPFPSDQIRAFTGYEGTEGKQQLAWLRRYRDEFPDHLAFAINTWYPEIAGGFYLNRELVALVQDAAASLGLWVVDWETYRPDGLVPAQLPGAIENDSDHVLVDQSLTIHARLIAWKAMYGNQSFYADHFIIDVLTRPSLRENLIRSVEERCRQQRVAFQRVYGAAKLA